MQGKYLVVVSGPSGSGKDTVVEQLIKSNPYISLAVSCTSREKRDYEVDGEHYYFITRDEFKRYIEEGLMLEWVEYSGNYYGTPISEITKRLEAKKTVILVIEVNGGMTIKKLFPDALLVFLLPPSMEELEARLRKRRTETDSAVAHRLAIAEQEMTYAKEYDTVIVNKTVEMTTELLIKNIEIWQKNH